MNKDIKPSPRQIRFKKRFRKHLKKLLPERLRRYRQRQYQAALAAKRTRRPVMLIKPTFE